MPSRSAYKGRRKLVLAFDIGTTYSGISYSVLDPGEVPEIKGVTRFPAHEQVDGASKIPTIIYYDRDGKVRAVGAEAASEVIYAQAEEEDWVKAEWFKLHLLSLEIPPLPLNKTVVEVFADFLAYLFRCASSYIQETHPNGAVLWASVKDEIDFVLSHPNGWEGTEQSEMRKAAVLAKLIQDTPSGHARLSFVTEGEAGLHFAIQNGLPEGAMKNNDGVVIVDGGGGTIDVSSYTRDVSASKTVFEEIAPPQSHFYGSVLVNFHARQFLKNYLSESPFVDDIDHVVHCFDKTTKLRFIIAEDDQYIKFGSSRDNDAAHNIRFGQLKLLGKDVASFFKPSIDCIVKAVMDQKMSSPKPISHVVLVGGFFANNYVFNLVYAALNPAGFNIIRPESHLNKAVSDGVISFYLDHFGRNRVSKIAYAESVCNTSPSSYSEPTRDKAKEDYHKVCADLKDAHDSLQRAQNDLKTVKGNNQELRRTNLEMVQDRVELQDELRKMKKEVEEYRKLLGIKERELMDASQRISLVKEESITLQKELMNIKNMRVQVLPTKADLLSASELSQKVNDLNEENFQAAAWFSESLVHRQRLWKSGESHGAYQTACTMIGAPAAMILITTASEPEPNPVLVRLVMQIYFAKFCSAKIERWYEGSEETNDFLNTIYGEIRRKEEQAVSGRWRAITHALTRSSPDDWAKDFASNLNCIMGIAGWELSSQDKRPAFAQHLKPIFKAILDIRIALGEHFTSADIEVYCPPPGTPFDPQRMQDALDDERGKQKDNGGGGGGGSGGGSSGGSTGIILGTPGIGLREVPLRGADNIILPPKVILQSTLQKLLQPLSAPHKTRKSKSTHAG